MDETNLHERLSQKEHQDVEERSRPSALIVHEAIRREGVAELERASSALAWSGLANHLPSGEWVLLVSKLGYWFRKVSLRRHLIMEIEAKSRFG